MLLNNLIVAAAFDLEHAIKGSAIGYSEQYGSGRFEVEVSLNSMINKNHTVEKDGFAYIQMEDSHFSNLYEFVDRYSDVKLDQKFLEEIFNTDRVLSLVENALDSYFGMDSGTFKCVEPYLRPKEGFVHNFHTDYIRSIFHKHSQNHGLVYTNYYPTQYNLWVPLQKNPIKSNFLAMADKNQVFKYGKGIGLENAQLNAWFFPDMTNKNGLVFKSASIKDDAVPHAAVKHDLSFTAAILEEPRRSIEWRCRMKRPMKPLDVLLEDLRNDVEHGTVYELSLASMIYSEQAFIGMSYKSQAVDLFKNIMRVDWQYIFEEIEHEFLNEFLKYFANRVLTESPSHIAVFDITLHPNSFEEPKTFHQKLKYLKIKEIIADFCHT